MIALIAVFSVVVVLRAAGSIAAFITGATQPEVGIAGGINVLFDPLDPAAALQAPALNAIIYWAVAMTLLLGLGGVIGWVWMRWRSHSRATVTPRLCATMSTSRAPV